MNINSIYRKQDTWWYDVTIIVSPPEDNKETWKGNVSLSFLMFLIYLILYNTFQEFKLLKITSSYVNEVTQYPKWRRSKNRITELEIGLTHIFHIYSK